MTKITINIKMDDKFDIALLNENSKNMYVVEVDEDIFVFEAGLKYADDKFLGVDYIIPDFEYLVKNKKRIKGVFLTHGHYENIGAVSDLLKEIPNLKVYATKFTKYILVNDGVNEKNIIFILHMFYHFCFCRMQSFKERFCRGYHNTGNCNNNFHYRKYH